MYLVQLNVAINKNHVQSINQSMMVLGDQFLQCIPFLFWVKLNVHISWQGSIWHIQVDRICLNQSFDTSGSLITI